MQEERDMDQEYAKSAKVPMEGDDTSTSFADAVEVTVFVHDELGLHARPAARVSQTAQDFDAEITLTLGSTCIDAKSILDVLSLAAPRGASITVHCKGPDAPRAARAMAGLFQQSLLIGGA